MAASVVSTVEIGRPPSEVFPYVTDPSRFGEWQNGFVSGSTEGAPGLGAKCIQTRKIGGSERTATSEITAYDPPSRWHSHGIDGPIRVDVDVSIEPIDAGQRSRVTIQLDVHGHGLGKLIAPVVASQTRKEVPTSCQKLKQNLEAAA